MAKLQAAGAVQDLKKIASRKVALLGDNSSAPEDSMARWAEKYLALAVRGVRSEEVAGKIARHLRRFEYWFVTAFGHDRVSSVTLREVAAWRDHLLATEVRAMPDGRRLMMAPATVNNHLAHLSAFFTWTAAHAVGRITQGNFRLVQRLFAQIGRILEINRLTTISREVVETARESPIIGFA